MPQAKTKKTKKKGKSTAETVICTYRVRTGAEKSLLRLLARHDATLRRLELVTARRAQTFVGRDAQDRVSVVDIFEWTGAAAADHAHHHPAVRKLWDAFGALVEERDGRPAMEFPHFQRVERPARPSPRAAGRR
jgi:hypothetical protein